MPSARLSLKSAANATVSSPWAEFSRDEALDQAKQEATDRAVNAGAAAKSVDIVDVEEVPLAYLPGNATRIMVKAVGDLVAV